MVGFAPSPKGDKKLKGEYFEDAALLDQIKGDQPCRVDSGVGVVIRIEQTQENPQFGGESVSELLIWFPEWPPSNVKYYLKPDNHLLCYREKGQLLLFETFTGQGTVHFLGSPTKGKLKGRLSLDLIEPHHNFSNGDFHHMEGEMNLKKAEIKPSSN